MIITVEPPNVGGSIVLTRHCEADGRVIAKQCIETKSKQSYDYVGDCFATASSRSERQRTSISTGSITKRGSQRHYRKRVGISSGCFATLTPAASSALILSAAVPAPPSMIAPA